MSEKSGSNRREWQAKGVIMDYVSQAIIDNDPFLVTDMRRLIMRGGFDELELQEKEKVTWQS